MNFVITIAVPKSMTVGQLREEYRTTTSEPKLARSADFQLKQAR